ncbi:K(+)-transporting ATPase subunit C [Phocaeicola sp.]
MKNFIKSFRLTLVFCVFFSVFYILILWIFAQVASPNAGNAEVATLDGKVVGAANVGQSFTQDIYFWGRPSCAGDGYDAASSGGSNKGPTNEEYLAEVEARIDTFLLHHPYLSRKDVPTEMVTASGSGLDPDITPACAYVQVKRVASARGMSEEAVKAIVDKAVEKPFLGMFGTEKVNVLKLNIALEESKK